MEIVFWHWWVVAFGLFIAELLLPTGFVLLWIGASALVVGALAWLLPATPWQVQFVLFAIGALVGFFLGRRFRRAEPPSDQPALNRRGHSYVGRTFTLAEPIVNGVGMLRVDDSQWRISGGDAAAGTRIRIVGVDGATLRVEPAH